MAQPGKYSKVEVLRKYVAGASAVAGTTHIVGSGLKPRRTGFWKVGDDVSGCALEPAIFVRVKLVGE